MALRPGAWALALLVAVQSLHPGRGLSNPPRFAVRRAPASLLRAPTPPRSLGRCHALKPLPPQVLQRLVPQRVSQTQWIHFWGSNEMSRASRIFEVLLTSFFGLWATWFLHFVIGVTAGTFIGSVFVFWFVIAPYYAAIRRNADFRDGLLDNFAFWRPKEPLRTALFTGRILRCERVVADVKGRKFMLRLEVEDEDARILQVRAPLRDEHARVREGQTCFAVIISDDASFNTIKRVSDVFIPGAAAWAGEYPYVRWERLPMQKRTPPPPPPQAVPGGGDDMDFERREAWDVDSSRSGASSGYIES